MKKTLQYFLLLLLLIAAFYGVYQYGKKSAEDSIKTTLLNDMTAIKKIAELSSLEVKGVQEITLSNQSSGNDIFSAFSNMLFQNTLQVKVPYTAKYGVNLNNMKLNSVSTDTAVHIYLKKAELLSYELQLNEMQVQSTAGWFVTENYAFIQKAQKILYEKSRAELSQNKAHIAAAQENIALQLQQYFAPFKIKVIVHFENDTISPAAIND